VARLRLAGIAGISPRLAARLVEHLGSAAAVLGAPSMRWREVRGVGTARAGLVSTAAPHAEAVADLERARSAGAEIVWPGGDDWPTGLDDLADPPLLLFRRGELSEADRRGVAIVGSRRCTPYGRTQAERLAAGLARCGISVISGLARGVDAAAHRGALAAGGRTVGVLGGGLARFYPPEHVPLARQIVDGHGAVLSEFPLDAPPLPYNFPRRNRILAAMASAVVVVEAGERSGSLHTADHALDLGREVLAVPGRVDHPATRGVHRLLREGAALCEGLEDILRALGVELEPTGEGASEAAAGDAGLPTTPDERALLAALQGEERSADALLELSELEPGVGLVALTSLELRGLVTLGDDGLYSRGGRR